MREKSITIEMTISKCEKVKNYIDYALKTKNITLFIRPMIFPNRGKCLNIKHLSCINKQTLKNMKENTLETQKYIEIQLKNIKSKTS